MDEVLKRLKEQKISRIAIMGGTFDPIHFGHLVTAETVRVRYGFDKIIFIPTGNPPHKHIGSVSSCEHRYSMVQMASMSNPYFEVSRMEIERSGSTYTIDTVREFRSALGNDTEIFFITGADAVLEILSWKDPKELLSLCKFIAVTRPGYDRVMLLNKVKQLEQMFNTDILIVDVPAFDISSTFIRKSISEDQSVKYLVPEVVEQYILKNYLYKIPE